MTLPAGCGSSATNDLVVNATHPSTAWTFANTSGTTYTMSQPMGRIPVPWNDVDPPEVDSWTTNDTVTVYAPVTSPIVAVNCVRSISVSAGTASGLYLTNVNVKQAAATGVVQYGSPIFTNESEVTSTIEFKGIEMTTDSFFSVDGQGSIASPAWSNSEGPPTWKGGILHNTFLAQYTMTLEGAAILQGTSFDINAQFNDVYIPAGTTLVAAGQTLSVAYPGQTAPFIWGPGTFAISPASNLLIGVATATPTLLVTTTKLNTSTTGCSTTNAQPAVTDCNIPVDGAHIDAVLGDAGGGGFLGVPSGASIATTASPF